MFRKLKLKIVLAVMGIVIVMLAVIFGLVYHFTKSDLENRSYAMLQAATREASELGKMPDDGSKIQLPYFVMRVDTSGQALAAGYSRYDITDEKFLVELVRLVVDQGGAEGIIEKYQLMYSVQSGTKQQTIVFLDISGFNEALNTAVITSLIIEASCIVIILALSIWFACWAVKPVEVAWKQQTRLISGVSQELKTPLAVVMSNTELLQDQQTESDVKLRCAHNIAAMSRQIRQLMDEMDELAGVENGQIRRNFARIDLSELVNNAALSFEPIMHKTGLYLRTRIQSEIVLKGSAYHLQQLVEILLNNARKYSAPGVVGMQLTKQGKTCLLTVSNPGEPIPNEELERIFDCFYRDDEAWTDLGSSGLGLFVAKTIVLEHKGKIWAISNNTGNCYCVQLPCGK